MLRFALNAGLTFPLFETWHFSRKAMFQAIKRLGLIIVRYSSRAEGKRGQYNQALISA
jgi:hypothetical protein